jgi:predicted DNA-binding ribbon-helix-helix protein
MIEVKQTRGITLTDGKKTSLHLESATWAAIDYIASCEGKKWTRWANEVLEANPAATNYSSVLRAAVMDDLLSRQLATDQASHTQALDDEHEIVGAEYYRLDDTALRSELDAARITHRDSAFNGFEVIAGYRGIPGDPAAPFLCIRSTLRGDLHAFIVKNDLEAFQ